jgi:hypothetical protein
MTFRVRRLARTTTLASLAAALLMLAPGAGAQLPRFVDCGDTNGFPSGPAGFETLGEGVAPADISLTPAPLDTVHVGANFPSFWETLPNKADVLCIDPDQLDETHRLTSLWLSDFTVLSVTGLSPDTNYRVRLLLGALAPWGELTDFFNPPHWSYLPSFSREVRVEVEDGAGGWLTSASGVRCTSPASGSTFASFLGGQVPVWVLAKTDGAGTLQLRLSTDNADALFLSAFELHEHESLPIHYERSVSDPLVGSTPTVAPFVAAFNSGDLDLARTQALALTDDFERGVALLHVAGWLDGSMHGLTHVADVAAFSLTNASASHPAAAWLLDEIGTLRRALDHLAVSGYEHEQVCPDQGGSGFLNASCEGQTSLISDLTNTNANAHIAVRELSGITAAAGGASVLDQLAAWNAGAVDDERWEPSPLVFAAAKLVGTTLVSMNPTTNISAGDPDAVAFANQRDTLVHDFVDLGFAATDFPDDLELILFKEWLTQGKLPTQWPLTSFETLLTEQQLADSWWGDRIAIPMDDPTAPPWANLQRQQRVVMDAVGSYWLEERLVEGALGGGLGDDVELLAQLGGVYAGLQDQSHRRALDAIDGITRWVIRDSGEVSDGYFAGGMTDVEHSAEYTTNTYLSTLAAYGLTATAGEIGLGVAERLLYAQDPGVAFADDNSLARTHFKSFVFTANGHNGGMGEEYDTLLNGRAMYPGVGTARRAPLPDSHPMVADLMSWADGWLADALDTTGGKPEGWVGPAQWPTGEFGKNGFWWNHTGTASDIAELKAGLHSFPLDLLRTAYHRSNSPTKHTYLIPAVRMFRSVMDWEDAGLPANPLQGGSLWAASKFKASSRFGNLVLAHLGDLAADSDLNTLTDPLNPATTYVDAALLSRMEGWVEIEFNGQPAAMLYALGDALPCETFPTAKGPQIFTGNYAKVISYYRVLYPLLTTGVIHTDRINLSFSGGGPANLLVAANGADITEGVAFEPLVRWRSPLGETHDLTVQCNARDYGSTVYGAFAHNFGATPLSATLLLDAGLTPGEYLVEWGAGVQSCDQFPVGSITTTATVQKRGVGTSVTVDLDPGLSLVRITRQGDADMAPADYDLALDTPSARLVNGATGLRLELEARAVNLGSGPSPASTLTLWATPMEPDGSLTPGGAEMQLGTWAVPALSGASGWSLDEFRGTFVGAPIATASRAHGHGGGGGSTSGVTLGAGASAGGAPTVQPSSPSLPFAQELAALVFAGQGLQLRAEITADGTEGDLNNNALTRGWLPEDMPIAGR